MNILITGAAGFIGFSLAQKLLKSKKSTVFGIDNLNNYYSQKLKKKRIAILNKNKNFNFIKSDINHYSKIIKKLKKVDIDLIFHFAAQAGVRYSVQNPKSYIHSNKTGFVNFLKVVKEKNPLKFIYASSSSIYGDAKKFPVSEKSKLNPKNLYARTKRFNESYVIKKLRNTKIKVLGLRLFTIYGEWGRPDMLILKFLECSKKNKIFELNNKGDHYRDFTYIHSAIKLILKITNIQQKKQFEIYNICSSRPVKVALIIKDLKKFTRFKKIKNVPVNKLEVYKTYGDNSKILNKVGKNFKFVKIKKGTKKTYNWFKKFGEFI